MLEYELFTAAADYALLVLEGALRTRFLSYYMGEVPVFRKGAAETLRAQSFEDVRRARGCKLRGADGGAHRLPVGAGALLGWARREKLLPGRRSRIVDRSLAKLRNYAAHPVGHSVGLPPHAAGRLCDVAEIINKLWGHDTPGGRLFPTPAARHPRLVAVARDGSGGAEIHPERAAHVAGERRDWLYAVFLAADGEGLVQVRGGRVRFTHTPGFQTTALPCELLWQGGLQELVEKIDAGAFAGTADTAQGLDRLFLIRVHDGGIDDARSPRDLLALPEPPAGRWHAVRADTPIEAWVHVRDHEHNGAEAGSGCRQCFVGVEGVFEDTEQAVALAREVQARTNALENA